MGQITSTITNLNPFGSPVRKAVLAEVDKRIQAAELAYAEESKRIDGELEAAKASINLRAQVEKEQALADSVAGVLLPAIRA